MPPKKPLKSVAPDLGTLSFDYQDVHYSIPLDLGLIPNAVDRELFVQSGLTVIGVLTALNLAVSNGQGGVFMLAALVFIGKRLAGESCKYADVEANFDEDRMVLLEGEPVEAPKASEAS